MLAAGGPAGGVLEPAGLGAEVRPYRWEHRYRSREYTALLRTHSDHIVLEPAKREALCRAVEEVIDRHGGVLALTYLTGLCLARAG